MVELADESHLNAFDAQMRAVAKLQRRKGADDAFLGNGVIEISYFNSPLSFTYPLF